MALKIASIGIVIIAAASIGMTRNCIVREQTVRNGSRVWTIAVLCPIITKIFVGIVGLLGAITDGRLLHEVQHEGPILMAGVDAILFLINLFLI